MEKAELVSIIVPIYNTSSYLSKCIDSLINQTYSNIEIILVNDGSTDNSLEIIKEFARKDNRIKVVDQKNEGLSGARNAGIERSKGILLTFVDSDDWIDIELVEKLKGNIDKVELVICSYNRVIRDKFKPRKIGLRGNFIGIYFQRRILGLIEEELRDPSAIDSMVIACAKLYNAKIIKDNNIKFVSTKEIGTEDLLFNLEYCEFISKVLLIDEPLYFYRRDNERSLTSAYKPLLFEQWKVLYSKIGKIIEGKDSDFYTAYYNRICLSIIGLGLNEMYSNKTPKAKCHKLNQILTDDLYLKAYQKLKLRYFPIHWKLFFYLAKKRYILGVYLMLSGINYFVNRNK